MPIAELFSTNLEYLCANLPKARQMSEDSNGRDSFWSQAMPGLRLWLVFIIYLGLLFVLMALAQSPSLGWLNGDPSLGYPMWVIRLGNAWVSAMLFALPVLVLAHLSPSDGESMRRLTARPPLVPLILSVLVVLVMMPGDDWLFSLNRSLLPPEVLTEIAKENANASAIVAMPSVSDLFANLLVMGLVAAVCEELFYRGAVQRLIGEWSKNMHVAVWVTAALFAIMHYNVSAFLPRCVLGALLGYLCAWGGSVWLSIAAHAANNALFFIYYYYSERYPAVNDFYFPAWLGPVSVGAAFSLVLALKKRQESRAEGKSVGF